MSEANSPQKNPIPAYFQVKRPAHFLARPDLIEELCAGERLVDNLPKAPEQYQLWLKYCGLTAAEAPYAKLQACRNQPYRLTRRYILQSVILPGRPEYTNIVTDGNLWVAPCEYFGLFDFVLNRAVEWSVLRGMNEKRARWLVRPVGNNKMVDHRRSPIWAVGYEPGTGLCTILPTKHPGTLRRFLTERPGR